MNANPSTEILFSATQVATAAGVDAYDLAALHPETFGVPGHWRMAKTGGVVYTVAGVEGLAAALDAQGKAVGAHSLRVLVQQEVSTPSRRLVDGKGKEQWFNSGSMA